MNQLIPLIPVSGLIEPQLMLHHDSERLQGCLLCSIVSFGKRDTGVVEQTKTTAAGKTQLKLYALLRGQLLESAALLVLLEGQCSITNASSGIIPLFVLRFMAPNEGP